MGMVERKPRVNEGLGKTVGPPVIREFDFFEGFEAGFVRNNVFASYLRHKNFRSAFRDAEAHGEQIDPFEIGRYVDTHAPRYFGVTTRTGVGLVDRQIQREMDDLEKIENSGMGGFAGSMWGSLHDPMQVFFPLAKLQKGIGIFQGAKRMAPRAAGWAALSEASLASVQQTRTAEESVMNAATDTFFLSLLGGGVGALGRRHLREVGDRYFKEIYDAERLIDGPEIPPPGGVRPRDPQGQGPTPGNIVTLRHAGPELKGGKLDLSFTGRANDPDSISPRMTTGISFSTKEGEHGVYAVGRRQYEARFPEEDLSGVVNFYTKVRDLPLEQRQAIVELSGLTPNGVIDGESAGNAISRIRNDIKNGTDLLVERGISGFHWHQAQPDRLYFDDLNKTVTNEIVIWDQDLLDSAELLDVTEGNKVTLRQATPRADPADPLGGMPGGPTARPTTEPPPGAGPPISGVGAGARDEGARAQTEEEIAEGEKLASAFGLEKLPDSPYKRLMKSQESSVPELTTALIEGPGTFQKKNFYGEATQRSVETNIRFWQYDLVEALNTGLAEYAAYRGKALGDSAGAQTIGLAKLTAGDLVKGRGDKMSYPEFRDEVSYAMRSGDVHDDPHVQSTAVAARKVLDKLKNEAIEADMFTADLRSQLKKFNTEIEDYNTRIATLEKQISKKKKAIKKLQDPKKIAAEEHNLQLITDRQKQLSRQRGALNKRAKSHQREIDRIHTEGPEILAQPGYLPRIWRIDKIENNIDQFRAVIGNWLRKRGVPYEEVEVETTKMIERIRRDHPFGPLKEHDPGIARSARERLIDIEDKYLTEFIENDYEAILRYHVRTFATDLEIVKRFDTVDMYDQTQLIKEKWLERIAAAPTGKQQKMRKAMNNDLRDFTALRDRLRGTFGLPDDPYRPLSRFYRIMKQWNYLTYLGGVVISALPDLARPIMVEGIERTMKPTFAAAMSGKNIRKLSRKETHRGGTGLEMVLNTRALAMADLGDVFGRHSKIERFLHGAAGAFSMVNLLNPWNTAMKEWAGLIIAARILETTDAWAKAGALKPGAKLNHDFVKLARGGIDQPMAERINKMFYAHGDIAFAKGPTMRELIESTRVNDVGEAIAKYIERARKQGGVFLPNTELWADLEAVAAFRGALAQDVDRTIVTPGTADRPLWMSTELGSVISQFKGFAVGAAQRVMVSGLQEKQAYTLYGILMMIGMGLIVNELKRTVAERTDEENFREKLLAGIDRSGVLGYFTDINRALENLSDNKLGAHAALGVAPPYSPAPRYIAGTVFGPSGSKLVDLHNVVTDWATGTHDRGTVGALRRMILLQNHFLLTGSFRDLESVAR